MSPESGPRLGSEPGHSAGTPGAYIRACRAFAGLSLDDVALRVETDPPVSARRRAEWLAAIEDGTLLCASSTAAALAAIPELHLDQERLTDLVAGQIDVGQLVRFRPAHTATPTVGSPA